MKEPKRGEERAVEVLEEQWLSMQRVDGDVLSTAYVDVRVGGIGHRSPCSGGIGGRGQRKGTDHFTRVRGSFLGHICSKASGLIFHCARILDRIDLCTDDFTLTWPETSEDGWNLSGSQSSWGQRCEVGMRAGGHAGALFEHLAIGRWKLEDGGCEGAEQLDQTRRPPAMEDGAAGPGGGSEGSGCGW